MNFNTDGFNDRTNYIHNANDINRLRKKRYEILIYLFNLKEEY